MLDTSEHNIVEINCQTWDDFTSDIPVPKNCLYFLHVNIRSIKKNFAQIEYIVLNSLHTIHILILTEVNIKNDLVQMFQLPDYNLYSELRTYRRGGGVLLYIHKSASFMRYSNLCTQEFECVAGEISINSLKIGLCAMYRPPDTSKLQFIEELSSLVAKYRIKQDYLCNNGRYEYRFKSM